MAKSLSEQIAAIANKPAVSDYDIEDNERTVFEHQDRSGEDSGNDSEDEKLAKSHYVNVGKSQLRDQGIALRDEKYQGAKGSRNDVFQASSPGSESGSEDVDEDLEESAEKDSAEDEEEEEQESDSGVSMRTDSADEDQSEENSDKEGELPEEDEDTEFKRQRLAEIVRQETKAAASKLSETTHRDAIKGFAILEQHRTFDHVLDARIKLQKALNAANELPLTNLSYEKYLKESSKNGKLISKTMELLEKVMGQLVDFRTSFQATEKISQNESHRETTSSNHKRTFAELCDQSQSLNAQLKEYRNAVLNKWSQKVASASGKSIMSSSKFKAIHQPADVQVENQLADTSRLLKRTRLNRKNVSALGFEEDLEQGNLENFKPLVDSHAENSDNDDLDIPKNYDPRKKDNKTVDTSENAYVFDDEDFYRVLLNDLVDKKIASAQNESSDVSIAMISRSNNKIKKNVDTKASKGRKLNFTVQEPIANYEAPINNGFKWSDEQIDEFCAGLLGQRIDFNEDHESEEEAAENQPVESTGIQIFG
ncbi:LAME_0H10242g1_1 [Lachancea meyersii CBS 8951]|uniref:Protein BFR2 n=1 Tax=Lachancea meyersii CBS 8951 TaxID=1266667 RepID=A0A1G4KG01_9SACH|nr:LAME_0H10242g1_1 [Lachancea meyersii CBS 8951]